MGLFEHSEIAAVNQISKLPGCGACKLHKTCRSPKIPASGKGEKGILIIADAPGDDEDRQGTQLVGEPGQLLRRQLRKLGIELDKDCRKINVVACRPIGDRPVTNQEIEYCRPLVWREIREFKPKLIILLGNSALESFLGHRWKKDLGGILKWRGWTIPDRELETWVCPTIHPAAITKNDKVSVLELLWSRDIERAIDLLAVPVYKPIISEHSTIEIIQDEKSLQNFLSGVYEWEKFIAIDYETTGLKPHAEGHRIVSCSITCESDRTCAFMMPEEKRNKVLLRRILMDSRIKKAAHNMKFEDTWSWQYLRCEVEGWTWDSMLAAHIIDNRENITGLKFQTYVHFGVLPYNEHIEPFLKGDGSAGANSPNNIHKIPKKDLLLYNGLDTLFEKRLAFIQMSKLGFQI